MQKEISRRVKRLLEKMRPEELALKMNVSVSTVYRWKDGDVKRPGRTLLASLDAVEGKGARVR